MTRAETNARYDRSEKGRARQVHYEATAKAKARKARYENDTRNQESKKQNNDRRLFVSGMYLGMAGFAQKEREEILNGTSD